ncbi:MAG: hypothetical protein ACYDH6_03460 [Acidimicrobiales bacterium]
MEEPLASTQKGRSRAAADRNAAAIVAGSTVALADIAVSLAAIDELRARALADVLGRLRPASGPPAVGISFDSEMVALPAEAPDESYGRDLSVWRRGEELYLADGTGLSARVTVGEAHFGGMATPSFRHLLTLALGHLLGFRDRFVLHAGLIQHGRHVALVPGESGLGKSTVVVAAHHAGWRVFGDDLTIVRAGRRGVSAVTLGLPLAFPGDILDVPEPGSTPSGDQRGRWTLPVPAPGRWRPVTDVVAPSHGTTGSFSAGPAPWRFEQGIGAFVAASEPLLLHRYIPVAAALSRANGWRVALPVDPHRRVAAVGDLLDVVLAAPTSASTR